MYYGPQSSHCSPIRPHRLQSKSSSPKQHPLISPLSVQHLKQNHPTLPRRWHSGQTPTLDDSVMGKNLMEGVIGFDMVMVGSIPFFSDYVCFWIALLFGNQNKNTLGVFGPSSYWDTVQINPKKDPISKRKRWKV